MRVIVTGDRNWYCPDLAEAVVNRMLARYCPGLVIVHGGATGVDRSFAEAAEAVGVDQEAHPARWHDLDVPGAVIRQDKRGRAYNANAGPARNAEMLAAGADLVVGFHRAISSSKGTRDMLRRAVEAGVPAYLVSSDKGEPKRVRPGDPRLG
jgi:hypothetical protein